jgi:hypothetical protein
LEKARWNWPIWLGLVLCVVAFLSYPLVFARFPATRDVPWANFVLFGLSAALLVAGLRRVFGGAPVSRGKTVSPILVILSLALFGFFSFEVFHGSRQLPKSLGSPKIGQKAPEFLLRDTRENEVSLASLLSSPVDPANPSRGAPKGVLLVFYRGYW